MSEIFFCIDKANRQVLEAGPLPNGWRNVVGLHTLSDNYRQDLGWAGHPNIGFFTREQAAAYVDASQLNYSPPQAPSGNSSMAALEARVAALEARLR